MAKCTESHKKAMKKYRQSEKGKAARLRAESTDRRKISLRKFRRSDKNKAIQKAYSASERGKEVRRGVQARYHAKYPGKKKARTAVQNAVAAGKMPRINTFVCECGKQAEQYHHPSYAKDRWFDVNPVCRKCHYSLHHTSTP